MSLFNWFTAKSKGDEKAATAALAAHSSGAIKEDAVVKGLDFVAAIEAHRKWKDRLSTYINGTSNEKLDYGAICRDDLCVLGKWIYGTGAPLTGHLPIFHQLKAKHAQFHVSAAQVVEQMQQGNKESAQNILAEGDFFKNSRDIQTLLSKLYIEMNAGGS